MKKTMKGFRRYLLSRHRKVAALGVGICVASAIGLFGLVADNHIAGDGPTVLDFLSEGSSNLVELLLVVNFTAGVFYVIVSTRSNTRIVRSPGSRLIAVAEFVYSRKCFERVFEPVIRDLQDEYCEALAKGQKWKARWVKWRGRCAFFAAALMQIPVSATKLVQKLWMAAH